MKNFKTLVAAAIMGALVLGACKKTDLGQMNNATQEPSSLMVKMTDNPGDYVGVEMEIQKVEAYLEGSGWVTLNNEAQFVDVAKLTNGKAAVLAYKTQLQAGHYTQLRIVFGNENRLTLFAEAGDNSGFRIVHTTDLTYSGNHEVIVNIDVQVDATAGTEVLVDFDIAKSIIKDLNGYVVKPAISWLKDTKTAVTGEVKGTISAAVVLTNGQDSVSAYTDMEGKFYLRGMKPGVYKAIIYPAWKTLIDAMRKPYELEGVVVVDGEVHYLGEITVQ